MLGRVFLPAGLAAGTYLAFANGRRKPAGSIHVKPTPQDALARPDQNPPQSVKTNMPGALNQGMNEHITGTGFSPNAAMNTIQITHGDAREAMQIPIEQFQITQGDAREAIQIPIEQFVMSSPVLAATADEIVLGRMPNIKPGSHCVRVVNTETREASTPSRTMFYNVDLKLTQNRLVRPYKNETSLQLTGEPKNMIWQVKVLDGPVSFPSGKETLVNTTDGKASLPVIVDPSGNGGFKISACPANIDRDDFVSQFDYLVAKLEDLRARKKYDKEHGNKYQKMLAKEIKIVKDALRNHWREAGRKAAMNEPGDE
jgi:hypothetical protein